MSCVIAGGCANYDEENTSNGCDPHLKDGAYSNGCEYCMNTKYPERKKKPFKYCKCCAKLPQCPKCSSKPDKNRPVTKID